MTLAAAPARSPVATHVDVSILVPAKDEAESLPEFMALAADLGGAGFSYEVVVVDDGSRDGTPDVLRDLAERYPFLRVVTHRVQRGIADAVVAADQKPRRSQPQSDSAGSAELGERESGEPIEDVADVDEAHAIDDPHQRKADLVVEDQQRFAARREAAGVDRTERVLFESAHARAAA